MVRWLAQWLGKKDAWCDYNASVILRNYMPLVPVLGAEQIFEINSWIACQRFVS